MGRDTIFGVDQGARVALRFFAPSPALRPYVTTLYLTDIVTAPGTRVVDYLHPEWANIRFIAGDPPIAAIGDAPRGPTPAIVAAGPSSRSCYFACATMRAWGIGILPLGWAKFFGVPAADFADRFDAASAHPAFLRLLPLAPLLQQADYAEPAAAARLIDDTLVGMLEGAPEDDPAILAVHRALVDESLHSVADLARLLAMSERSVERLSLRAFGFAPKLLLRRQRFLRSLGRFMLDPSMAWTRTLDVHYHDQAQFTRDFHRFMGMSPSDYAALPKPILGAAVHARAAAAGAAMQVLHTPEG